MAVKSYDTISAVKQVIDQIAEDTCILTLQNGLGNIEKLIVIISRQRALAGVTTQASTIIDTGEIIQTPAGLTIIGELDGRLYTRSMEIASIFNECNIKTKVSGSMFDGVWMKVLFNAGINSTSALTALTNGELTEIPEVSKVIFQAVKEGEVVARRLQVNLGGIDPIERMLQTALKSYRNKSSML